MSQVVTNIARASRQLPCETDVISQLLLQDVITPAQADYVKHLSQHCDTTPDRIVIGEQFATSAEVLKTQSLLTGCPIIPSSELEQAQPEFENANPDELIRHAVFPCWISQGKMALVVSHPDQIPESMADIYSDLPIFLAERHEIQNVIAKHARTYLLARARARVRRIESARKSEGRNWVSMIFWVSVLISAITLAWFYPVQSMMVVTFVTVAMLLMGNLIKTSSFLRNFIRRPRKTTSIQPTQPLPKISMLVPMYDEAEIIQTLIARLRGLTYPKALLEVVLILEENDENTQNKLAKIELPHWMRVVIVPAGGVKTKPHAMNYALDFCMGDIIGIYDAEDWPEPEQLTRVARKFETLPDDVACLQGILDFYNASQNWLSRCFTIEYATWFRMVLPGMCQLGFCIPLGGTTLFVRRQALEDVGAWDAYNVTEDADLGMRLARYGYRTEMINIVTDEEANCRLWPWMKQRSRWLKGYLMTYLVHMRRPFRLLRQIGLWRFLGFQAHFLSAIFQFLLAPVLWSFWLVLFGFPHPLTGVLSEHTFLVLGSLFLSVEALNVAMYMISVSSPKHRHLLIYAPTMHFYWPIGVIAAMKGVYEIIFKPYFWDKTRHGLSLSKPFLTRTPSEEMNATKGK